MALTSGNLSSPPHPLSIKNKQKKENFVNGSNEIVSVKLFTNDRIKEYWFSLNPLWYCFGNYVYLFFFIFFFFLNQRTF